MKVPYLLSLKFVGHKKMELKQVRGLTKRIYHTSKFDRERF